MAKKKLTKAAMKKKFVALERNMYDLFLDKLGHADSLVPFSQPKMMELHKNIQMARRKLTREKRL